MTFFGKFAFLRARTDRESVILHENSGNVNELILGLFKANDWRQNEYIMVYTELCIFTNRLRLLYSATPRYIRNGQCPKRPAGNVAFCRVTNSVDAFLEVPWHALMV